MKAATRKILAGPAVASLGLFLASCESFPSCAPPIDARVAQAGRRQHADVGLLTEGRTLFLNRCIQCHALPNVGSSSPARVHQIVATMSGRANLKPAEHEAVLKYLLTVQSL